MNWPSPEVLVQIGGWCFAVIVCAIIIAGMIRGDIVPGWIHKREIARADKATDLLESMTGAIERSTAVMGNLAGQVQTLVGLLGKGGGR